MQNAAGSGPGREEHGGTDELFMSVLLHFTQKGFFSEADGGRTTRAQSAAAGCRFKYQKKKKERKTAGSSTDGDKCRRATHDGGWGGLVCSSWNM